MYAPLKMNFCKDRDYVNLEPFFQDNSLNNLYDKYIKETGNFSLPPRIFGRFLEHDQFPWQSTAFWNHIVKQKKKRKQVTQKTM